MHELHKGKQGGASKQDVKEIFQHSADQILGGRGADLGFCGRNVIAIKLHFGHHDIIRPHCSRPGVHADGVFHNIGQLGHAGIGAGIIALIHQHGGGEPANFLEIGGEAYTLGKPALELVLSNPRVKCLLVNFCGAFARCDVMAEGIVAAWEEIKPTLPVFFSVHGTGDVEARQLLKARLDITPYDTMDQACKAAVEAAQKNKKEVA